MNHRYTWNRGKLKRAYMEGVECDDKGVLKAHGKGSHFIILDRVNSYEEKSSWGRLKLGAEMTQDCILLVLAFAADGESQDHEDIAELNRYFKDSNIEYKEKKEYIKGKDPVRAVGKKDILLYALKGQYLWIYIEVLGEGSCEIRSIELTEGDNFMQTFPEIYQEEGSFFHRYMSIFSSVYNDVNDEFGKIDTYLDLDTAPAKLLSVYAKWLGLEPGEKMLEEKILRRLVKNAYSLNKMKGTLKAVELLVEIFTGTSAVIIDYYTASRSGEKKYHAAGLAIGPDDVIIISSQPPDKRLHAQLMYFSEQFLPVRCRIRILFIPRCSTLGNYGYMDFNAVLSDIKGAVLDKGSDIGRSVLKT